MNQPEDARVILNARFERAFDGTGTWTRCLRQARPQWSTKTLSSGDAGVTGKRARATQLTWEAGSVRWGPADVILHPYWAAAVDRRAVICALDLFHYVAAHPVEQAVLRTALRRAQQVVTISNAVKEEVRECLGVDSKVLTPFPDTAWFSPPPSPPIVVRSRVAYWGGWHPRKRAFEALPALMRTGDTEVLVMAPLGLRVPATRAFSNLGTHDLIALVDSAEVAVFPSTAEGLGLPVFEALLRGKPVVLQRLACYSDFMDLDGRGVFTFEDGDWNGFVSAVREAQAFAAQEVESSITSLRSSSRDVWQAALDQGLARL